MKSGGQGCPEWREISVCFALCLPIAAGRSPVISVMFMMDATITAGLSGRVWRLSWFLIFA